MNFIRLLLVISFPTVLSAQRPGIEQGKLKLSFGSESEVVISGSSNVTGFTCIYQQDISCRGLVVEGDFEKNAIVLSNATLSLESCGFDCGSIVMNKDFRHTIKSKEHPEIVMEIHELHFEHRPEKNGEKVKVKALVHLTVAGVKKIYSIDANSSLSENNLYVTGLFSVYMTDFCLSPPSLLFGMVTVDPILEIGFRFVLSN